MQIQSLKLQVYFRVNYLNKLRFNFIAYEVCDFLVF